jgi:hypothetical protein
MKRSKAVRIRGTDDVGAHKRKGADFKSLSFWKAVTAWRREAHQNQPTLSPPSILHRWQAAVLQRERDGVDAVG